MIYYIWLDSYTHVEVTKDVYHAYYRPVWATYAHARRHGRCSNPDWRICKGDCGTCSHRIKGDISSIEELMESNGWDIAQDNCDPADLVLANMRRQELANAVKAIDPDGVCIVEMLANEKTVREIAKTLHIPRSTCADRIKRLRQKLRSLGF